MNGYTRRASKYNRGGGRRTAASAKRRLVSAAKRVAKAARTSKVAKLRTTTGRKKAISRNTTAIRALKDQVFGPIQEQRTVSDEFVVVASRPCLFLVNNPGLGTYGPQLLREHDTDDHVTSVGSFSLAGQGLPFYTNDGDHCPNGPKLLLKEVDLQFKIHGFLDDTRVRIDIIRQKKAIQGDIWNPQQGLSTFMPHIANGLKYLAGFNSNEIPRDTFQVLQTRHVYLNSKGQANVADTAADRNTTDATTVPTKYCHIKLRLNKVCKQLESSLNESTGADNIEQDVHTEDHTDSKGNYSFDNQHPLSNIWCVVSSDDATAIGSALTGDAVKVTVLRKCIWRDPRA